MATIGLGFRPVYLVQLDRGILIRIVPGALAHDHLPPHAAILHGLYPAGVLYLARLVEIEYQVGSQDVASVIAHHHGAPRGLARRLHAALQSRGIGREPALEHHVLVVQVEVHRGIVYAGGLMDVDIKTVFALHLQGGLHASGRERGLRRVAPNYRVLHPAPYLAEFRGLGRILLGVVVARYPPGGVVARHGELGVFLLDEEVVEGLLLGELIAQSHAVVINPEADDDVTVCGLLSQVHLQFVVVIANGGRFAPYGFPSLVKSGGLRVCHLETIHQVGLLLPFAGVFVLGQFQSQVGGLDNRLVLVGHFVSGLARLGERESELHVAIGRGHGLCRCPCGHKQSRQNEIRKLTHVVW